MILPDTAPAAVIAESEVGEFTVKASAATPPIVTLVVPVKFVPVILIVAFKPLEACIEDVIVGGSAGATVVILRVVLSLP